MDADDEDPDLGGGGPKVIGVVLSGGCSGGVAFRGGDMGISSAGGRNGGGRILGDRGIHHEEA